VKPGAAEILSSQHVLDEAEDHADAGRGEPDVPADALSEIAADERATNAPVLMPM
jgi:hypothetical protein